MGWAILGLIVVLIVYLIMTYNGLVAMRQRTNQAFADIDVQLKQRHDLIPNLVETVKGYATHEKSTLDAVIAARNAAQGANTVHVIGRSSDYSLYDQDLVTFEEGSGNYDHRDAAGFIKLNALRLRTLAQRKRRPS